MYSQAILVAIVLTDWVSAQRLISVTRCKEEHSVSRSSNAGFVIVVTSMLTVQQEDMKP